MDRIGRIRTLIIQESLRTIYRIKIRSFPHPVHPVNLVSRWLEPIACIALLGFLGAGLGCQNRPTAKESEEYVKRVAEMRQEKDKKFRADPKSPIAAADQSKFTGLIYYPPDIRYRIKVTAKPYAKQETVEMLTSTGSLKPFLRYAYADFSLNGQTARLTIYASQKEDRVYYFLPFKDASNGRETYPAGRYLDLEIDPQWRSVIDFNLAYNPFCAYSKDYACPVPPPENHLKLMVRAGERYREPQS